MAVDWVRELENCNVLESWDFVKSAIFYTLFFQAELGGWIACIVEYYTKRLKSLAINEDPWFWHGASIYGACSVKDTNFWNLVHEMWKKVFFYFVCMTKSFFST